MDLTSSVARLMRAGDDRSRSTEKLQEAADRLAKDFFAKHLPSGGDCFNLPLNYSFKHWDSGEYLLAKNDGKGHQIFGLTQNRRVREELQLFAKDIAHGWLDEVSKWFEADATELGEAARAIETFLQPRS